MTRETKLGLAVALAFLALVGGVLGVKLMQGDGLTAADGSVQVAEEKPPESAPLQPTPTAASPPAPVPAPQPMDPVVPAVATAPAAGDAPKPAPTLKPDADAVTTTFTTGGAAPTTPTPEPAAAPPPAALPETPAAAPPPTPDTPTEAPKPADPFAVPPPPGPPPGPVPPLETPKTALPEIHNEKPKPAPIVLPSGGSVGDSGPATTPPPAAPLTAPPPAIAPVVGANEANSQNMTPATPPRPESPGGGLSDLGAGVQAPPTISRPTTSVGGTNESAAGSMAPAVAAPAPPAPAPVSASPPNSVTFEKPAGSTGTLNSPSASPAPVFTAPRSPETLAPEVRSAPSVRIESADPWHGGGSGNVAAVGLAPPTGATGVVVQPPAAGRPPLVKPVPPGGPKAQSYLVEEYRLQTGDNFENLSQKFYFSPKYAAALQRYNQNEPLAAPGLRTNPPMLSTGQVVWMPPARILERDYGELIPGLQPLPADRGAPGVPTAVRPVAPTGPVLYKVRARGESLREIARHTLNDSNQWAQILNLNRTLKPQPEIPIAPGTILRLPPEAKIDATDRP